MSQCFNLRPTIYALLVLLCILSKVATCGSSRGARVMRCHRVLRHTLAVPLCRGLSVRALQDHWLWWPSAADCCWWRHAGGQGTPRLPQHTPRVDTGNMSEHRGATCGRPVLQRLFRRQCFACSACMLQRLACLTAQFCQLMHAMRAVSPYLAYTQSLYWCLQLRCPCKALLNCYS